MKFDDSRSFKQEHYYLQTPFDLVCLNNYFFISEINEGVHYEKG